MPGFDAKIKQDLRSRSSNIVILHKFSLKFNGIFNYIVFWNSYPRRSSIRAFTTGVGPLTTNSQYTAPSIRGRAKTPITVITVGLNTASATLRVIVSVNPDPVNKPYQTMSKSTVGIILIDNRV